jgi:hypothetical protein
MGRDERHGGGGSTLRAMYWIKLWVTGIERNDHPGSERYQYACKYDGVEERIGVKTHFSNRWREAMKLAEW